MIDLRWDEIDNTPVLVYEFRAGWAWKDFHNVKQRADTLLDTSSIKIPLVFDLRNSPDMPPGMIMETFRITKTRHMNGSPVIIVKGSRIVHTTYNIVRRMMGKIANPVMTDIAFVSEWDDISLYLRQYHPAVQE